MYVRIVFEYNDKFENPREIDFLSCLPIDCRFIMKEANAERDRKDHREHDRIMAVLSLQSRNKS
jgi:hypothetical protein